MDSSVPTRDVLDLEAHVPPNVVFRAFPAETVMLNVDSGQYHGVNPTGGRMLEVLQKTPRVRDAAAAIAAEYGVPARDVERDLSQFCIDLAERQLIRLDDPSDR
jgi:hypothetical protein